MFPVKVSSGQDDGSAVKRETRLPQKRRYQTYQTNLNPVTKKNHEEKNALPIDRVRYL